MPASFAIVHATTPTDGSVVNYESSGFGTPDAAIVLCDYQPSSTIKAFSIGYFDGTNQFVGSWRSTDNVTTTDTYRSSSTSGIVGKGSGVTAAATGWSTNGITIDWDTTNFVAGNITVILIKGVTNAAVFNGVFTFDGTEYTKTLGFRPTYIDLFNTNETAGFNASNVHVFGSRGFVHINSVDAITQAAIVPFSQDALFTGVQAGSKIRNDACASIYFGSESAYISATGVTATGWKYQSNTTQTARYMAGLALEFPDDDDVSITIGTTATTATTKAYTGMGFQPDLLQLMGVKVSALNADDATSNTLTMFNGVTDGTNQYCYAISDQDGPTTANANQSFAGAKVLEWTGSAGNAEHSATISSMDSDGATLSYSAVEGTARNFVLIGFGDSTAGGSATVTGAPQLQGLTASGQVDIGQTVTGTPQLQALTASGAISVFDTATITGTPQLQALTASGTITVKHTISGTPQLQTLTASGSVQVGDTVTISGTPQLQALTTTGAFDIADTITGSPQLQAMLSNGTIIISDQVTGTPQLQALTATGTVTAIGAVTLEDLQAQIAALSAAIPSMVQDAMTAQGYTTTRAPKLDSMPDDVWQSPKAIPKLLSVE